MIQTWDITDFFYVEVLFIKCGAKWDFAGNPYNSPTNSVLRNCKLNGKRQIQIFN